MHDRAPPEAQSLPDAFLAFLQQRELRVFRAWSTGERSSISPAALSSVASAADGEWVRASGRAQLYSWAVYRRQYHADFPPPYTVAAVVLEEGPLLISTIPGDAQHLALDMPLTAAFDETGRLIFKPTPLPGTS